jgi:hypothetical protein
MNKRPKFYSVSVQKRGVTISQEYFKLLADAKDHALELRQDSRSNAVCLALSNITVRSLYNSKQLYATARRGGVEFIYIASHYNAEDVIQADMSKYGFITYKTAQILESLGYCDDPGTIATQTADFCTDYQPLQVDTDRWSTYSSEFTLPQAVYCILNYPTCFVRTGNGEITQVWVSESSVPRNYNTIYRIK